MAEVTHNSGFVPSADGDPAQDPFRSVPLPARMQWYRALVPFGHAGAGRADERELILCATDMVSALSTLKGIPGWKRTRTPSVSLVKDQTAIAAILAKIESTPEVTLARVLKDGFYFITRR